MNIKKLIILGLVLFVSCRRSTFNPGNNPPGPQYDPRNISRTDSTQSSGAWIAIGKEGTIYVAWMDGSRTGYDPFQIYFRYKPPGRDWSDIEILSDSLHNAWAPHIVVDPFDNVHLVWYANTVGHNDAKIYYRMRDPSGVWSRPMVLSGEEQADQPRIAADPSGTIHVIWNERSFKYRRRFPNGTWSEIESGPVSATNPSIAVDSNGGVHLVCESGHNDIYYLYRSPTGTWNGPVILSDTSGSFAYAWAPSIAVSRSGVVWANWSYRYENMMCYAVKEPGGEWSDPDTVPGILGRVWDNMVEFDRFGWIHYVWEEWRNGSFDIYYRYYDGRWSDVVNVSQTSGESLSPDLAVGNDGIYIVWNEEEERGYGYNYEIYLVKVSE